MNYLDALNFDNLKVTKHYAYHQLLFSSRGKPIPLIEWMKLYVNKFLYATKKLATCEKRPIASILNSSVPLSYYVHHPTELVWASIALSISASSLLNVGPQRLEKASHCVQSIIISSLEYIFWRAFINLSPLHHKDPTYQPLVHANFALEKRLPYEVGCS